MTKEVRSFDVVVVGAGAAGVGLGVTLRDLGIESFVILDRAAVGASFLRWPRQMRFITPSFNSTQFGALDLNAVCLHTSPAYSIGVEHPTGEEYAGYLQRIAKHFDLPVETRVDVLSVATGARPKRFRVETSRGDIHARFVVWAGGEMQYPRTNGFRGAELCLHNSQVTSWDDLGGDERCIIGGSESGVDAAVALAAAGRRAVVFDREEPWTRKGPDPSQLLSPFTKARLNSAVDSGRVTLRGGCPVIGVRRKDKGYQLALKGGHVVDCAEKPILASGFVGSASLVRPLFDWRDDGFPLLTEDDESTVTKGLFLVGPSGLLDRLTSAMNPWLQPFGMTGREMARVVMGFGCNVPAVIGARSSAPCSRGVCVSAIAFGSACSYQLGATLAVFAAAGRPDLVVPYLLYLGATTLAYARLIAPQAARSPFNVLLTEGRVFLTWPRPRAIWLEAQGVVREFFRRALPVFFLITAAASLLRWLGALQAASAVVEPAMAIFRLPSEAALAVVMASVRKDGILLLAEPGVAASLSAGQLLTAVYLAGVLLPCLATCLAIAREQGRAFALRLVGRQAVAATGFSALLAWGGAWL